MWNDMMVPYDKDAIGARINLLSSLSQTESEEKFPNLISQPHHVHDVISKYLKRPINAARDSLGWLPVAELYRSRFFS
jgi:hypothetical protein